ncbi:MAG: hypothetical protein H7259_05470 [Cytophagales bacterium]|nr:hypothetical protein [Cytophaga sp.]
MTTTINTTFLPLWKCVLMVAGCMIPISLVHAQTYSFTIEDTERSYIVHLPTSYLEGKKYPLVFNFHGMGSSAKKEELFTEMDIVADKEQFIVVYPQAYHNTWNTGLGFKSYRHGKNDIGFINQLLDTLIHRYRIDTQRIYSVGVSLGGFFNYRVGCELSHRIAAIASVSGLMTDSTMAFCYPSRDIPVLHFHGTHDRIMKYKGVKQCLGVEETVNLWVLRNHCKTPGDTIHIPDICPEDKSTVDLIKYSHSADGAEVWYYKIYKGGHTWPGGGKQHKMMGRKNRDINASEAVWEFFKKFTLQTGTVNFTNQ